jgi:hypothetical protein
MLKLPIPGIQIFSFQDNNLEGFCTVKYAYINIFLQCKRVLLSQNNLFLASGNQSSKPLRYPDKPVVEQSWFWMSVILEARISFLQSRQIVFSDTGMIIWLPP